MPARLCLLLALADAAPLSAPAFSLVFPFLKMVLTEMPHHSEEEEERMAQILQILTVHAQLRASPSNPRGRVDEVGRGARLSPWLEGVREARTLHTSRPISGSGGVVECGHVSLAAAGCSL